MNRTDNGYEVVVKNSEFIVTTYYGRLVTTHKFPRRLYALRDVLDWIDENMVHLYAGIEMEARALGTRMLTPGRSGDAITLAGEACIYVLRVTRDRGFGLIPVSEVVKDCELLSEAAVRKAIQIGVEQGQLLWVDADHVRLRKQTRLAEKYEAV